MTWTFERRLLLAAMLAWAIVALLNIVTGPPLGHDESAFSIVARGDNDWFYRSRGVIAIADLGIAMGGADWQMRIASAVIGLGVVLAVYAVGRAAFDARSGAWAAAVIATAHPMLARNADLLGDLPACAGMLFGIAVLIAELDRPAGPRMRLVLAAPAFAFAFYMRYGSAPIIAIAGVAALLLWWRALLVRPLPVLVTVLAFAVLLVPHARHSLALTGSLLGVLHNSAGVPRRAYVGEGLVTYLTANPFVYYGALVAPVILGGLVGLARRRFRARGAWLVALVALGQVLALGLESHGQPRYVYLAVALLVVLGVEQWRALAWPRVGLALVGAAWLAVAIGLVPYHRSMARTRTTITAAAATIRADRDPAQACIFVAGVIAQLAWYARCEGTPTRVATPSTLGPGRARYIVSTPYGVIDGPALAAALHVTVVELPTGLADARVWRVH